MSTRICKKTDLTPFRIFQLDIIAFGQDPNIAHEIWGDDKKFRDEIKPLYEAETRLLKARFAARGRKETIEFTWWNLIRYTFVPEKYFRISTRVLSAESGALLNNADPQDYLFS